MVTTEHFAIIREETMTSEDQCPQLELFTRLIMDIQAQITAQSTVLHELIKTHHDKDELDFRLADAQLRLEAVMGASISPDLAVEKSVSLLTELRASVRR